MFKRIATIGLGVVGLSVAFTACKTPALVVKNENRAVPVNYNTRTGEDSLNTGLMQWQQFFTDPNLDSLISQALRNNQELNITTQELTLAQNEANARRGEYMPFVGLRAEAGVDRPGRYTLQGATEEALTIRDRKIPDPLSNFAIGGVASWEVDIWRRLRNARQSAILRYQASTEGRNFMITNLIGEIASSYYELLAYDNQLVILKENIEIQSNALRIVRIQKEAARVTELAVRRFEAQVLNTRERQFTVQQRIVETENRINFLVGRYPQPVARTTQSFATMMPAIMHAGIPSQLLANRPDIKRAELDLAAAKLDVQVARANFYPRLDINAGLGFAAFNPMFILSTPQSLMYSLVGGLTAPLVNRIGIKSVYQSANARQTQAVYNYERTILNAYVEVANQLANINNLQSSYDLKTQEVLALTQSTDIANTLFGNARADYMEVLLTQREALDARFDQVDTRQQQMMAVINIYRALGGGWR
ncbi:TolC family protein [Spirosoma rhododendri]|uniref:TolC family protein n=1 Tax=Spirosoma rhododendri TaxID=2728024 RepID=A0A7L5DMU3_9BACT|nr:TolC family protein [Spirosoma rhododendri]QJD79769.1 TolC family protein [Spirosoma rhododendri]